MVYGHDRESSRRVLTLLLRFCLFQKLPNTKTLCFSISAALPPHPMFLQLDDLVRLPDSTVAFVHKIPGEDDSESDSDDDSIADERGRLTFLPQDERPRLISQYDDVDGEAADAHTGESPEVTADCVVCIAVPGGGRRVVENSCVNVIDRVFEHGAIVRKEGVKQSGIVTEIHRQVFVRYVDSITQATVNTPDMNTVFSISDRALSFVSGLRSGDSVVRGDWVGVIDYFQEEVYVQFPDKAICCIPGHKAALRNADIRTPDRHQIDPFSEGLYYPGQRVKSLPHVWQRTATWIRGAYTGVDEGVVKSIGIGQVGVQWIAKNLAADGSGYEPIVDDHHREVTLEKFEDLVQLEAFRMWKPGDRGYLIREQEVADDEELDAEMGEGRQRGRLMNAQRKARLRNEAMEEDVEELEEVDGDTWDYDVSLSNPDASAGDVVQVVSTKTVVTILWQDGTRSKRVPATDYRSNDHPDPFDFWPGDVVSDTVQLDLDTSSPNHSGLPRLGWVVRMNQAERTALVRWSKERLQMGADGEDEHEEEVSVYELKGDEFDVSIGDTVMHVPQEGNMDVKKKEWVGIVIGQKNGMCTVAWNGGRVSDAKYHELVFLNGTAEEGEDDDESYESESVESQPDGYYSTLYATRAGRIDAEETDENEQYAHNWGPDEDEAPDFMLRGCVEGRIKITDMMESIHKAKDLALLLSDDVITKCIQVAVEYVTNAIVRQRAGIKEKEVHPQKYYQDARLIGGMMISKGLNEWMSCSLEQPGVYWKSEMDVVRGKQTFATAMCAAFESVWKDYSEGIKLFTLDADIGENGHADLEATDEAVGEDSNSNEIDVTSTPSPDAAMETEGVKEEAKDIEKEDEMMGQSPNSVMKQAGDLEIEPFEVCEELDEFHKFSGGASSSSPSLGFLSVVSKEWRRLQKSLPQGIVVRVCESHQDRIRAIIVGPQGTPYEDVLFFFDIQLGAKYPIEPPSVWFHAHGKRLNPNLYEDGSVCLSILGTWDGDDVESWDPKTSNLLRILISLQALVFVEEPYYNEAGYQRQRGTAEGTENSKRYNESAFLLCLRHMLQTLRGGPADCVELAQGYYRREREKILKKCRERLEGAGSLGFQRTLKSLSGTIEKVLAELHE